jgi:DNA-binding NtrC family response regulator
MVQAGEFRDDLYFRLSVVPIHMPPLRDRREDIPLLVHAFLKQFAEDNGKPLRELSPDAMQAVLRYHWPGNVRELRTAIEHGVVLATGPKIALRDLPVDVRTGGTGPATTVKGLPAPKVPMTRGEHFNLHDTEERLILRALEETGGNVTRAAQKLGISRRTLHRKLKELRKDDSNSADGE